MVPAPLETQGHGDILTRRELPFGQEQTLKGFAAARGPAGVRHSDVIRQALDDHQEMRVDDRRTAVRDPEDVLRAPVIAAMVDPADGSLGRDVQELDSFVPAV